MIVKALRCLEYDHKPDFGEKHRIDHLFDLYPEEQRPVKDTTWIPAVASDDYKIITVDHAQKKSRGKHAAESEAYRSYSAVAFWLPRSFVSQSGGQKWEQASKIFLWWPKIVNVASSAQSGELFDLDEKGNPKLRG